MNKEQLRKELEDCWGCATARSIGDMAKITVEGVPDRDTYITTRLAALDDGDDKKAKFHDSDTEIYYKDDGVDDGQEGKGLRWVKASERLPEKNKVLSLKYSGVITCGMLLDEGIFAIEHFDESCGKDFSIIEWLDESAALPVDK